MRVQGSQAAPLSSPDLPKAQVPVAFSPAQMPPMAPMCHTVLQPLGDMKQNSSLPCFLPHPEARVSVFSIHSGFPVGAGSPFPARRPWSLPGPPPSPRLPLSPQPSAHSASVPGHSTQGVSLMSISFPPPRASTAAQVLLSWLIPRAPNWSSRRQLPSSNPSLLLQS